MDWPVEFTPGGNESVPNYYSSARRGRPSQDAGNKTQLPQYLMKSLGSFATITKKLPPHLDPAPQRTWGSDRTPSWEKQITPCENFEVVGDKTVYKKILANRVAAAL